MDQQEAKTILKKAFSVLTAEELDNFRFHLSKETPVLCRTKWELYADGTGKG